jgi:excisionase family DNA binding protein
VTNETGGKEKVSPFIPKPPYYHHRLNDAAKSMGVCRETMLGWIRDGLLTYVPLGREIRILEAELIRFGQVQADAQLREREKQDAV